MPEALSLMHRSEKRTLPNPRTINVSYPYYIKLPSLGDSAAVIKVTNQQTEAITRVYKGLLNLNT